jgi:beta-galactosidase
LKISDDQRFLTKYRTVWQVLYVLGTLKVVAYFGGKPVATKEVKTVGAASRVVLEPDRARIRADGEDFSFVTVRVEDADGNFVFGADNLVRFTVEGAGRIAAVDNGNAASLEPFQAD